MNKLILTLSLLLLVSFGYSQSAIDIYKRKVDSTITNKTQKGSILPSDVGGRLNDLADILGSTTLDDVSKVGARTTIPIVINESDSLVSQEGTLTVNGSIRLAQRKKVKLITFIADDGRLQDTSWFVPKIRSHGKNASHAIVSGLVGQTNYLGIGGLYYLKAQGEDIIAHTVTHPNLDTCSPAQLENELRGCKKFLDSLGFNTKHFVAPFGAANLTTREAVRRYYGSNFVSKANTAAPNEPPINTYSITRYGFDGNSVQDIKAKILEYDSANSWMILTFHPGFAEYNDISRRNALDTVISFIDSLGIPVVTVDSAMKIWENLMDIGDPSSTYFQIGMDGTVVSSGISNTYINLGINYSGNASSVANATPSDFPDQATSFTMVQTASATGLPDNAAGTLITTRRGSTWSFQQYYEIRSSKTYYRHYDDLNLVWLAWQPGEQSYVNLGIDYDNGAGSVNGAKLQDFPDDKTSMTFVQTASAGGLPGNVGGTLFTTRHASSWGHQVYRQIRASTMFIRSWNDLVADWTAWTSTTSSSLDTVAGDARYFKDGGNAVSGTAVLGTTNNNAISIISNSTEVVRVNSNQRVGIGNSSPAFTLHVGAGTTFNISDGNGGFITPGLGVSTTSASSGIATAVVDGTNNRRIGMFVNQTNGFWGIAASASSGGTIPFLFLRNNTELARFNTDNTFRISTVSAYASGGRSYLVRNTTSLNVESVASVPSTDVSGLDTAKVRIPITSTKTSNYAATLLDCVVPVSASSGDVTITIPSSTTPAGRIFFFKKVSGANNVILDPEGAKLIDGNPTYTISTLNQAIMVVYDGNEFLIL